jgi:hypothetical protein
MIFPELPKKYKQQIELTAVQNTETPLRWNSVKDTDILDPAANSTETLENSSIDWFARDAWEFYAVCVSLAVWITYWLGVHRGTW